MTMGHPDSFLANDGKLAKLELTFKDNPYTLTSIGNLENMRNKASQLLKDSRLNDADYELYFAGETAKQADVKEVNDRDTWLVVLLVTTLITLLLIWQTRSLVAPIYMIGTILLSYAAAMGIGNFFFQQVFGYDSMSYRIPLYTFVFLVALGVDYSIMLMSRIQEEMKSYPLKEAIQRGLAKTGGIISSAGLILAATFSVLITQPIMELFMFGFIVAVGILLDTFLVRTILVPAIINVLGKWSFWPYKKGKEEILTKVEV
jgi:RND superfamily putative drug exporter